jgi:glutamine synthetase
MATVTPSPAVSADSESSVEEVRNRLAAQGVKYCLAAYTDVHGVGKAKAVPIGHLERMLAGSELFTGAALDGIGQGATDDELAVMPCLDRAVQLPWRPEVAWVPGPLYFHGEPWPMCSRVVLQRAVDRAAAMGYVLNLGIETEFSLVVRDGAGIVPANGRDVLDKPAYDIVGLLDGLPFLDEMVSYMNILGWDVHSFDHEDTNSQFEFDFSYTDAMSMADRQTLWRMMIKEVARRHGFEATMMPKPFSTSTGTGAHFNMSLADVATGENLFADPQDPRGCGLSGIGYAFIAGVLAHGDALTALAAPTVNSYKRLIASGSRSGLTWAPVSVSYGNNNRTHMLRVPNTSPRVETRAVDPTCNPYLTAAAYLHAGLDGIEQGMDPGDPIDEDMYSIDAARRAELGVTSLPRTLLEAVEALAADPFSERVLGPDLTRAFVELKTTEWWDWHHTVSAWEIERYLTFF